MERSRRALVGILCLGLFALVAEPAAAQTSINDQLIGNLNNALLYAAIPITILVQAILIYAVFKFRNNDDPKPTQENRRLEITWTVATAIVLLFVGLASYQVMADPFITAQNDDVPDEADVEIEVVAFNYGWNFNYQDEGIQTTGQATIPTDTQIYFNVGADAEQNSYIHGFHVPDLGLKQDANPGQRNMVKTEVYEEGEYQGYCSKYCGVGHSNMYFTINAVSEDEYQQWVQEQQASAEGGNESQAGGGNESGQSGDQQAGGNTSEQASGNESQAGNESGGGNASEQAGGNASSGNQTGGQ
ncbi:cytochrome c oxidase subunit II [Halalkalicoccus jeotgali]|uniref:cytochrome-c oxidase n=1 Tax=Halalkalicoccus jeotgali (strain DSM 18796 / CECT 7217 / JCM 14584 / KCTC 4019 / B3) TaxID=795797 RepID=D8J5K0_HALJB|nr:cytochrome c oxidase subunit II [Halalkalicoccus jeotgali]ADJ15696.1 cytochrome-c-like terminal oxidase, subunit II [Halalkalicoccus jeotgali B3]ELY36534.1 cytochrome c oxidase subunit II [Halalkalicoccus jeotgali B3]